MPRDDRPPSLRALAAFDAAARLGSFADAAAELNLTPSAISHSIRSLELDLGFDLFTRSGRGIALTPDGQVFATKARLGLSFIAEAFGKAAIGAKPTLHISTLQSIASHLLFPALEAFRATVPELAFELTLTEQLDPLTQDRVDLAIRFGPGEWPNASAERLADETLIAVCAPSLWNSVDEHTKDLSRLPLIEHSTSAWRLWAQDTDLTLDLSNIKLRLDDAGATIDAACAGLGAAVVRKRLAQSALQQGKLVHLSTTERRAEYSYYAVWRKGTALTPSAKRFIDWFGQHLQHG
ncbi:MAG: LysR substrate-binding domain-containing protein [Pseudomonadota bacterium]